MTLADAGQAGTPVPGSAAWTVSTAANGAQPGRPMPGADAPAAAARGLRGVRASLQSGTGRVEAGALAGAPPTGASLIEGSGLAQSPALEGATAGDADLLADTGQGGQQGSGDSAASAAPTPSEGLFSPAPAREAAFSAAAPEPRGASAATVSALSAEIARQAGQKVSRFEVALNPVGLGRVDVALQIGTDGRLAAALRFDRPDSAEALAARAPELESALRDAGFEVAAGDLSFALMGAGAAYEDSGSAGDRQRGGGERLAPWAASAGAAFDREPHGFDGWGSTSFRAARGLDIQV